MVILIVNENFDESLMIIVVVVVVKMMTVTMTIMILGNGMSLPCQTKSRDKNSPKLLAKFIIYFLTVPKLPLLFSSIY